MRARSTSRSCGSAPRRRASRATGSASPPTSPLAEASAELRALGFPTSGAGGATAGGRSWRAVHVHGLLPDPFPVPVTTRPPKRDGPARPSAWPAALAKIPAVAQAATRKAGSSMVVVTEYDFDATAWRAPAGHGPEVLAVELGTGGGDWSARPAARLQTSARSELLRDRPALPASSLPRRSLRRATRARPFRARRRRSFEFTSAA